MYQKWFVSLKKWCGFFDTSSRIEQLFTFVADMNCQSEILVGFKKVDDLFSEMMYVDNQFVESGLF